jgi:hypothetical protein
MTSRPSLFRFLRRYAIGTGVLAGTLTIVATWFIVWPLPRPLLRLALVGSAPILLSDFQPGAGGVLGRAELFAFRFWGNLLSFSLAKAYVDGRPSDEDGLPDVEFVMARLAPLRRVLLSQNELPHAARNWFSLLSAVGYCDQLNRAGALVLAQRFGRAQTYSVFSADGRSGHVVGRVWSREIDDWLYFDLWPVNLVVFRYDAHAGVRILRSTCDVPSRDVPRDDALAGEFYARVPEGVVLNEYPSSFGEYLWSRRRVDSRALGASVSAEFVVAAATAVPSGSSSPSSATASSGTNDAPSAAPFPASAPMPSAMAREYMRQRFDVLVPATEPTRPIAPASSRATNTLLEHASDLIVGKLQRSAEACADR